MSTQINVKCDRCGLDKPLCIGTVIDAMICEWNRLESAIPRQRLIKISTLVSPTPVSRGGGVSATTTFARLASWIWPGLTRNSWLQSQSDRRLPMSSHTEYHRICDRCGVPSVKILLPHAPNYPQYPVDTGFGPADAMNAGWKQLSYWLGDEGSLMVQKDTCPECSRLLAELQSRFFQSAPRLTGGD